MVTRVSKTACDMPLWRLQTFAHGVDDFLYAHAGDGHEIELCPAVAYWLRAFHGRLVWRDNQDEKSATIRMRKLVSRRGHDYRVFLGWQAPLSTGLSLGDPG